ncbi:GNAT family N-acetyltransferase [Halorubrum laminariae]|uniref:GNAT family N-acetyltransferase n=1 Tax=Halorubrum laminariae TaxID=1433523 RepID=A0ABD6C328_9EURY|nr:GNAT family N-acetyltransferase [Halorubrum laminariae]
MSGERDPSGEAPGGPAASPPDGVVIEPAVPDDRLDILRVLDAAMLETDAELVGAAIGDGDAVVARFDRTGAVVGALVATRPKPGRLHVDAVAVRRPRRGRGIGSALVAGEVRRGERDPETRAVTAEFDAELTGFYRNLGFDVASVADDDGSDGRFWGRQRVRDDSVE